MEAGALSSIMWAEHQTTIDAMHFRVKFPGLGFEDGNDVTAQKAMDKNGLIHPHAVDDAILQVISCNILGPFDQWFSQRVSHMYIRHHPFFDKP